jgi:hypothetical protein
MATVSPLRVGWAARAHPLGLVDMSFMAQAVRSATRMRRDLINCSFVSEDLSGPGTALDAAIRAGVTVVAAAGNSGSPSYIGEREDVIAVAATNASDRAFFTPAAGQRGGCGMRRGIPQKAGRPGVRGAAVRIRARRYFVVK